MATAVIENNLPAIYPAMQRVMAGIANIPKTGEMKFGATNYKYLKADDVQEKLNPLLTENNVVVASQYDVTEGQRGNRDYVYVTLTLTYISAEDGSHYPSVQAVGEAIAGDDKSINKALTQAIKNAHRTTFQFASGEPDPDDYAGAPETKSTPAQRQIQKAKAAPKTQAPKPTAKDESPDVARLLGEIKAAVDSGTVTSDKANQTWNAQAKTFEKDGLPKRSVEVLEATKAALGI